MHGLGGYVRKQPFRALGTFKTTALNYGHRLFCCHMVCAIICLYKDFLSVHQGRDPQVPSDTTGATGLSGRYAAALYELADADNKLDKVADDLRALAVMIGESDDLARLVSSPVLSRDEQTKGILALCKKAGMDELTQRFVGTTAQNRRLFALPGIIKAYLDELSRQRGEASAEIVSAQKLDETQLKAVTDELKKAIGTKVSVEQKVDESLLGGMIVKVGSRMIDSSLKTKLQQLRLSMKGVG